MATRKSSKTSDLTDEDFAKAFGTPEEAASETPDPAPPSKPGPRSGYVFCEIVTDGEVSAVGYKGGEPCQAFHKGDIAELTKEDAASLPHDILRPI